MIPISRKKYKVFLYILFDTLFSIVSWELIYFLRVSILESYSISIIFSSDYIEIFPISTYFVSVLWVILFYFHGDYKDIYQCSRFYEVRTLPLKIALGTFIVFILFIVNDVTESEVYFITILFSYLIVQYFLIIMGRLMVLSMIKKEIRNNTVQYNTVVISDNPDKVFDFINTEKKVNLKGLGINILGYLLLEKKLKPLADAPEKFLGYFDAFYDLHRSQKIEMVILNLYNINRDKIRDIVNILDERNVDIKMIPNIIDISAGSVKTNNILGLSLVDVKFYRIPEWEQFIKRFLDILFSVLGLLILSPMMLYLAFRVILSSRGPVIYRQERIGYKGVPFHIFKFRSMYDNAERNGPQLTQNGDRRITKWGKVMRKWKLDELPQLWNVMMGDMSLVGPRPMQKYFIDQLDSKYQYYRIMFNVKPGVTSLGMIKFGYAASIPEIIHRMKYDLIYIKNASILLDFSILFFTISTVLKGKGK